MKPYFALLLLVALATFWIGCDKSILTHVGDTLVIHSETKLIIIKGDQYFTLKPGADSLIISGSKIVSSDSFQIIRQVIKIEPSEVEFDNLKGKGYNITVDAVLLPNKNVDAINLYLSIPSVPFIEYIFNKKDTSGGAAWIKFLKTYNRVKNLLLIETLTVKSDKANFYLAALWRYFFSWVVYIGLLLAGIHFAKKIPKVYEYIKTRINYRRAIQRYKEAGGTNETVLAILVFLKKYQRRVIYVSFKCENRLVQENLTGKENEKEFTVFTPYKNFLPEYVNPLEDAIVLQLNQTFGKIISNDVFYFEKGDVLEKKAVFFEIVYTVSHTQTIYSYEEEALSSQRFAGIVIGWKINIFINNSSYKKINFESLPAKHFTVPKGSSVAVIFDYMAKTSFIELNDKLQAILK